MGMFDDIEGKIRVKKSFDNSGVIEKIAVDQYLTLRTSFQKK
jgi:hypothetical protein